MSGISIEFNNMFPWIGGIGGVIGFHYSIPILEITQVKYKSKERGKTTVELLSLDETKYKLVDMGTRKFDVITYTDDEKVVSRTGTYYIDIIQYTDTQRFIVAPDQTVEI